MLVNNSVFLVLCAALAPWWWRLPSGDEIAFMVLVGLAGLVAQYLLYEGLRRVPASLAAPLEYSGLLWAFGLGYLIWNDVPATAVFLGAGLIVLSGALVIIAECQATRASPNAGYGGAAAEPSITA
jgi:drug/metabolite transporter (DMT)-like permease